MTYSDVNISILPTESSNYASLRGNKGNRVKSGPAIPGKCIKLVSAFCASLKAINVQTSAPQNPRIFASKFKMSNLFPMLDEKQNFCGFIFFSQVFCIFKLYFWIFHPTHFWPPASVANIFLTLAFKSRETPIIRIC